MVIQEKEFTEQHELIIIFSLFTKIFSLNKLFLKKWLNDATTQTCDAIITENEFYDLLKLMKNDKTPGNDVLSKKIYEVFWDDVKTTLCHQ